MAKHDYNVIAIHAGSVRTSISDFVKRKAFGAVPFITYRINDGSVRECIIDRPIVTFHEGCNYRELQGIMHEDRSLIHMPSKDFDKLRKHSSQCINRVTADLITSVVVKELSELADTNRKNLIFIEGIDSNKTIGRLGYLYLDSTINTIAFLSYKPSSLFTNVLNTSDERLLLDMYYFKRDNTVANEFNEDDANHKNTKSDIIPNDFRDSLMQFVLFDTSVKNSELDVLPVRCDIMSQGIPSSFINEKVEMIRSYFDKDDNMTPPFQESTGGEWMRIPRIMYNCIECGDCYTELKANRILEKTYE